MTEYCLNIRNVDDLSVLNRIPISEILVESETFSHAGEIKDDQLIHCFSQLMQAGKNPVLVWDLLNKDDHLSSIKELLAKIVNKITAIRFRDPGVGLLIKERYPDMRLQFSMEHCYQNHTGAIEWIKTFGPMLTRIIFSNQVPLPFIEAVQEKTDIEIELLGAGLLEIFYSRRELLTSSLYEGKSQSSKLETASLDRPTQISNVTANAKGTKVFYDKVLFILEEMETIQASRIATLRLELVHHAQYQLLAENYPGLNWISLLKNSWSKKMTRGFLHKNHTNNPFKRLTNQFLKNEIQNRIGMVLESVKQFYTLIRLIQPIELPMIFYFFSPEGREIKLKISELKSLHGKRFEKDVPKGLYIHPWIKYTVPMSLIKTSKTDDSFKEKI